MITNRAMLSQTTELFRPYLLSGERVLWTTHPKRGLALSARDGFLIPFSLMWGGFALFWNVAVWSFPDTGSDNPDLFFKLWGLPFLVAGIYFVIGRFFHDAAIRKKMFYAVTDQRILILRGLKLTSLDIDRLPRLELSENRDGTGTLTFEATNFGPWGGMNGFSWWLPALSTAAQFFRIDNARKVYELIRNQAHS
jgi:hypothetical protein